MLAWWRTRLSFANVVSCIALFVAIGGSAYAAKQITSAQIKDNSIKGADIKNASLGTDDLKPGTLPGGSFLGGSFTVGGTSGYEPVVGAVSAAQQVTTDDVDILSPAHDMVARDLSVRESARPAADTRVYTLVVNGANTALSCTISDAIGSTVCSDTSHDVVIPAGSRVAFHYEAGGNTSGGFGRVLFGIAATTP